MPAAIDFMDFPVFTTNKIEFTLGCLCMGAGIVTGYGLNDQDSILCRGKDTFFFICHRVQTGSGEGGEKVGRLLS
jgi:hypothetical protein